MNSINSNGFQHPSLREAGPSASEKKTSKNVRYLLSRRRVWILHFRVYLRTDLWDFQFITQDLQL